MRRLLERRDGPAIRDTVLLFALLLATGGGTVALWGAAWVVIPYLIYAVLCGTSSDPRWHEWGHGTAFKTDCPPPYPSILSAWREIWPALRRQVKDPGDHIKRQLPPPAHPPAEARWSSAQAPDADGWVDVCAGSLLGAGDALRIDHGRRTYAIYRGEEGELYATDGVCTHGNAHLVDGLVIGKLVECPKHNGRFHLSDGSPARAPVCRGLATHPIVEREGRLFRNVARPGGAGARPGRDAVLRS